MLSYDGPLSGVLIRTDTEADTWGHGHVETEATTGGAHLQEKECQEVSASTRN